jgi:hypothetical protein
MKESRLVSYGVLRIAFTSRVSGHTVFRSGLCVHGSRRRKNALSLFVLGRGTEKGEVVKLVKVELERLEVTTKIMLQSHTTGLTQ